MKFILPACSISPIDLVLSSIDLEKHVSIDFINDRQHSDPIDWGFTVYQTPEVGNLLVKLGFLLGTIVKLKT